MTRIALDAELRNRLHNLTEPLELCDELGQVVGRVFPTVDASEYQLWEPEVDKKELRRREQSNEWYSTAQVLEHLEKLESQE